MKDIKMDSADFEMNSIEPSGSSDGRRILIYILTVFISTYLYEYFFVVRYLKFHPDLNIASISLRLAIAMFFPAFSVVVTRIITGEGFSASYINFNVKNGKYRYYLLAWFVPSLITILGTGLYFICFRDDFSMGMEYILETYTKQGITGLTPEALRLSMISQGITSIIIGPVVNCLTSFGEEWGWRGYLLQKLKGRFKPLPLMLIMGIIWGLWHAPLILMGYNYGMGYQGYPVTGILAMSVFCFSMGTLLGFVTLKTDSCIPAVIGHGAINGFASIGVFFTKTGGKMLYGPSPAGLVSGIPLLVLAFILIWLMNKDEEKQK